eukprot:MONOS_15399.1-p1 / transcript=MONOS_15399.1 / gene=MONOS_15399 / organism=Monocercomonoides_exilis_PA203 / gene_product=unspecified product / transcript_product=unspecified product / location=Mono_scaffold01221:7098-8131(-) / protein_length=325 / sequence_SO=supercontig / SO=protein_coding / is_pseudo=false
MKEMIIDENEKKEEMNEKIFTDLCECYALLGEDDIFGEVLSTVVPCILKVALNKEESEETRKEVEVALLALSNVRASLFEKELYLNEIKEVIQHHQEYHNLTRLAYQSAWMFLVYRLWDDNSLEEVIVNELHFVREATKELKELTKCVNWKREKEEEDGKVERKEEVVLLRWLQILKNYFCYCELRNEEFSELLGCIVRVYLAAKENHRDVSKECILFARTAEANGNVKIDGISSVGTVDAFLWELHWKTLNNENVYNVLEYLKTISARLREKKGEDEMEEAKRKAIKMEIFEKMEEEGYEDMITSLHEAFRFFIEENIVFIYH